MSDNVSAAAPESRKRHLSCLPPCPGVARAFGLLRSSTPMSSITPALIRDQLTRILSSPAFAGAPRMARFLDFVVTETLRGNAAQLKEIVIGVSVFDRAATYDPRADPIVRVEARRLRAKLAAYYDTAGQDDELIIALGRGSYAPAFHRRSEAPPRRVKPPPKNAEPIAVIPFRNLHHEDDSDHFADGLFEELIGALMRIPGLRVIAWNSDWPAARQHPAAHVEQTNLSLRYILRGSIRKHGERMRVAAQLLDGSSQEYLWSDTYDGHMQDPFAIQERIAHSIASSVKERLFAPPCGLPDPAEKKDTEQAPGTP